MDVRCPQCTTLYEIDERQLRGGGATLKCSQCEHVFRLQTSFELSQENAPRWMLRRAEGGDVLYFGDFTTLHAWIMQQEALREDEISRTGNRWTRLVDIGEFRPVFKAVDSIANLGKPPAASQRAVSIRTSGPNPAARPRQDTSSQFGVGAVANGVEAAGDARETGAFDMQPTPPRATPVEQLQEQAWDEDGFEEDFSPEGSVAGTGRHETLWAATDEEKDWPHPTEEDEGEEYEVHFDDGSSARYLVLAAAVALFAAGGLLLIMGGEEEGPGQAKDGADEAEEIAVEVAIEEVLSDEAGAPGVVSGALATAREAAMLQASSAFSKAQIPASQSVLIAASEAAQRTKLIAQRPDPDQMLIRARRLLESGKSERARAIYQDILKQERRNVEAVTGVAWSLLAEGKPSQAARQFRRALVFNASFGDAYIGLGKAERELGNRRAALAAYTNYLDRFPSGTKASIASYQKQKLEEVLVP